MTADDLPAVKAISDQVHGAYTEGRDIYAERRRIYPSGCFVLEGRGAMLGYMISHPWQGDDPPALDELIDAVPEGADRFYLHDLALLPAARGTGAASAAIDIAMRRARAEGFDRLTLTAVNGAEGFWLKRGFRPCSPHGSAYGDGTLSMECLIWDAP